MTGGDHMSYFDEIDWVVLGMRMTVTSYGVWRWWEVCRDEANFFQGPALETTTIGNLIAGTIDADADGNGGY
jgi:hypothetical protein